MRRSQCDLMSISPKLANSTPEGEWAVQHDKLRIRIDVIRRLMEVCDYQLKFVVSRPEDIGRFAISCRVPARRWARSC